MPAPGRCRNNMVQAATYGRRNDAQVQDGDTLFLGLNSRLSPDKLPAGLVAASINYRMRSGDLDPRKGMVKPGWLNGTNPGMDDTINPVGQFYGAGVFRDPSSVEWVMLAADGFVFRCREHNTRFALTLPTGVKVLSACSFVQAFNKVYCFRGKAVQPLVLSSLDTGFEDILPRWSAATVYNAAVVATGQVANEVAYGPFQAVTSVTSVADIATVVTTVEHGFVTGADITISGAVETAYNGRFNITVVDANTFTYQFTGATSPATGTIKCSNMAYYWQALGTRVTLTSLTHVTTTATATKNGHGFSNGQYVTIAGATPAAYNGTFVISNVAANTFDYTMASDPGANATGTITARTSVVLAAQSPDTNPEAWTRLYNVLPNADDALYINNRLLVPTAYTPGASAYDSSSNYTKKDFIVATDIQDDVHFDFSNAFRINQGSDDEIVCLVKYGPDTAIVVKGKSWGVLSNIALDLSALTLDMKGDSYGGCALRSAVVAGRDVLFPSTKRGVSSIQQNSLGQIRSVDVAFSNDIRAEVGRINWNFASSIRLAWWDDKLYAAVPLDGGRYVNPNLLHITAGLFWINTFWQWEEDTQRYTRTDYTPQYIERDPTRGNLWFLRQATITQAFSETPDITGPWHYGPYGFPTDIPHLIPTVTYATTVDGVNNAILVYDYRVGENGQWQTVDQGEGICPLEFFKANYNGEERLFFIAADGYVNLIEEATAGDQVYDAFSTTKLTYRSIETTADSRGYRLDTDSPKKFKQLQLVLGVWNAKFSVDALLSQANSSKALIADKTFSRTTYLRPFDRTPYVEGNANDDFATAGRGNYSVLLTSGGVSLGSGGVNLSQFQEITTRKSVIPANGRFVQVRITNTQGRCQVKSIAPLAAEGQRRGGATFI